MTGQPPLLHLPTNIFTAILQHITEPKDYFQLARTCRTLWDRQDPIFACVLLDARILWSNASNGPDGSTRRWPPGYEPLLYWCLRRRQPVHVVARLVERYYRAYPEAVQGSRTSALRPAVVYAMAANHLGAVRVMLDMGVVPPLADLGAKYMDWAVELCGDLAIPRWLAENGVRITAAHMLVLDRRGLASSPEPEWRWFLNQYLSHAGPTTTTTTTTGDAGGTGGTGNTTQQ
ncbi:hypothetical protein F4814DRAFT_53714 [Daldinia grandis]|nr:hypothetical protein F4814DRAFT_53714 [Daldinia grandis]